MNWTEQQYERVARRLDGQDVDLTEAEQALAQEIRRSEAAMKALGGERPSAQAMLRTRNAMRAAVALHRRPVVRRLWYPAAAAAALLLAVVASRWMAVPRDSSPPSEPVAVAAVYDPAPESVAMDIIADQLDQLTKDIVLWGDDWQENGSADEAL